MTRCGEPDCRYPAHQPLGLPANVTYRPLPRHEWDRRDPNYDDHTPRPLGWDDVAAAVRAWRAGLVFLGIVVVVLAMSVVGYQP